MITQMQESLVEGLLQFDNAQEVILTALKRHSKNNPAEIINVLNAMNMLVADNIRINQEQVNDTENALAYSVSLLSNKKIKNNIEFVTALDACKILVPNAETKYQSESVINYYESMLEYLKEHESEYLDSDWAISFNHNKYLHTILGSATSGSPTHIVTEEQQNINY